MSTRPEPQPVVVIGANGFVGRRVVRHLAASEDFRPVAAARRLMPDAPAEIEWRQCDATSPASLAAALSGAAYAVNCVAGNAETLRAATENLCRQAGSAGLRRVVHLSSMSVYGSATGLVDEAQPLDPGGNWYARAKVASETIVQDFVAAGGDAVTLRPGCIHGPGSEQWTGLIGRLLRRHRIGDLGPAGDGLCNLVHVDDVADAVLAALRRPGISGEAFNVGDPDPGTWNSYFTRFARAIGATPVRRISPRWLQIEGLLAAPLKAAAIASARAGMKRPLLDPLPRSLRPLWRQDIQLDHRKADVGLGFTRTPPDLAIASAAAWFNTSVSSSA